MSDFSLDIFDPDATDASDVNLDEFLEQGASLIDNIYRELNESRSAVENIRQSVNFPSPSVTSTPQESSVSRSSEDFDEEIEQINNYCEIINANMEMRPPNQSGTSNSSDIIVVETPMPNSTRTIPNRVGSPEIIDLSAFESIVVLPRRLPFSTNEVIDLCSPPAQDNVGFSSRVRRSGLIRRPINFSNEGVGQISSAGSTIAAINTAVPNNTAASNNRPIRPLDRLIETEQPTASKVRRTSAANNSTTKDNSSLSDDGSYKCPICLETARMHEPTTTKCGHVFCNNCIKIAVQQTHKCPLCNTKLNRNQIFRIYI